MSLAAITLVAGVLLALATGGRPSNAGELRAVHAITAGVALQLAPQLLDIGDRLGLVLVLGGYVMLLAFALANLRLVGMPIALLGLGLNLVVIGANGGMPVRASAVVAAEQAQWHELPDVRLGAKRHLEHSDDRLAFLGDTIPVRPLHEVASFGDLILAVGIGDVAFRLLRPAGFRRQRRSRRSFVRQPLEV